MRFYLPAVPVNKSDCCRPASIFVVVYKTGHQLEFYPGFCQMAEKLHAAHVGQLTVQQDAIEFSPACKLQAFLAVCNLDQIDGENTGLL